MSFYGDVLALPHLETLATPRGTIEFFGVGSSTLKLVRYPVTPSARPPSGEPGAATGLRYFTIRISNLDEVLANCESVGVIVLWGKRRKPGGDGWLGMVMDPDGNMLELLQNDV